MRGALTAAIFSSLCMASSPSLGQTGRVNITQAMMPFTVTASGPYRVTENLTVTNLGAHGITIRASDVNIDLRGHEIRGPGQGAGCGIFQAAEYSRLTVSNGTVSAWLHDADPMGEAGHGVMALGGSNMLNGILLMTNTVGAFVTERSVVSNCNVLAGRIGIRTGPMALVFFVTAYEMEDTGYELGPGTHAVLCTCYGARLGYTAASNAYLNMCTAYDNRDAGIEALDHVFIKTSSTYQNQVGMRMGSHAQITDSSANGNTTHGIQAGDHAVIMRSASTQNGEDGIRALADSEIISCSGSENGQAGIRILGPGCLVESNKTVANSWGIRAETPGSTVVGNISGKNREQDYFAVEGNTVGDIVPFTPDHSNMVEDANFRL